MTDRLLRLVGRFSWGCGLLEAHKMRGQQRQQRGKPNKLTARNLADRICRTAKMQAETIGWASFLFKTEINDTYVGCGVRAWARTV